MDDGGGEGTHGCPPVRGRETGGYRAGGCAGSVCGVGQMTWLDATAQAELVRRGEVSPKELVEEAIARIETVNPKLDAVIRTRFDAARQEAEGDLPDGPFRGVPILYKDLGWTVAGGDTALGGARLCARRGAA